MNPVVWQCSCTSGDCALARAAFYRAEQDMAQREAAMNAFIDKLTACAGSEICAGEGDARAGDHGAETMSLVRNAIRRLDSMLIAYASTEVCDRCGRRAAGRNVWFPEGRQWWCSNCARGEPVRTSVRHWFDRGGVRP